MDRRLLLWLGMSPETKKQIAPSIPPKPEDVDFADEAGPKKTEFEDEDDAKAATTGGFDPIP